MRKLPRVGIFDSGIGGLNVLHACIRAYPCARYFYLGDNARAPYGERSAEEIACFVREAMKEFEGLGADAAVLACNTATAVCAEQIRAEFAFPVIGMEPAVKPAANACGKVLVLATPRTAESLRLRTLISRFPQCRFTVHAAAGLAGAIEAHLTSGAAFELKDFLLEGEYGGVVLGCTHYSFFRDEIANFYGCRVFDGAEGTAARLKDVLIRFHEREISEEKPAICGIDNHRFYRKNEQNANICFYSKVKHIRGEGVVFLGKSGKINQNVYFSNICFRKK